MRDSHEFSTSVDKSNGNSKMTLDKDGSFCLDWQETFDAAIILHMLYTTSQRNRYRRWLPGCSTDRFDCRLRSLEKMDVEPFPPLFSDSYLKYRFLTIGLRPNQDPSKQGLPSYQKPILRPIFPQREMTTTLIH